MIKHMNAAVSSLLVAMLVGCGSSAVEPGPYRLPFSRAENAGSGSSASIFVANYDCTIAWATEGDSRRQEQFPESGEIEGDLTITAVALLDSQGLNSIPSGTLRDDLLSSDTSVELSPFVEIGFQSNDGAFRERLAGYLQVWSNGAYFSQRVDPQELGGSFWTDSLRMEPISFFFEKEDVVRGTMGFGGSGGSVYARWTCGLSADNEVPSGE